MILVHSIIQSSIVFIFLTVFFYLYVSKIEKEEFEIQLDKIVDDIFNEYSDNFKDYFPNDKEKKEYVKTVVYGIIVNSKNKIEENTINVNKDIDNQNKKIVTNSIYMVLFYILLSIIILSFLYWYGYLIDLKDNIKEGLFILFFIFLVEFFFLNMITKNYISGNANYFIKTFTKKIIDYINENNLNQ